MPPKRQPYNELGKSGKYYRDNKEAREVKKRKDTEINSRPEQKAKRRLLANKNNEADKKGVKRENKDLSHTPKGLKYKSYKENRGNSSDTKGDRRARAKRS